jgi:hypothetical protein
LTKYSPNLDVQGGILTSGLYPEKSHFYFGVAYLESLLLAKTKIWGEIDGKGFVILNVRRRASSNKDSVLGYMATPPICKTFKLAFSQSSRRVFGEK